MTLPPDGSGVPARPQDFNLAAHVLAAGMRVPEKIALMIVSPAGAERWSHGRLLAAVRGCGTGLLRLGLAPGDRILMRIGNSTAFPVLFLGAIAAGLVPVPTSAALTKGEITPIAARISPALIVAEKGIPLPDHNAPVIGAEDILRMADLPPCDWDLGDPERLAYIVLTSGTSGRPMAVAHAHRAILARSMMHQGWEGLLPSDRLFHAGALNWTFTLGTGLLDPWTLGATAIIPRAGVLPAQIPLLLKRHDATIVAAAPGVFRQMLKAPLPALPRLRHGLTAGETLVPSLRQAWRDATGTDLHEALGMSECSTYISGSPARPAPEGFSGYPQPGRHVAILIEERQASHGEIGEITIRADDPGLMLGYLDDPEATAARYRGGWFRTGDMGERADDGCIRSHGRSDDLINAGGFRVAPQEIEKALSGTDGVREVAVAAVSVKEGVEIIACAYVADRDLDAALAKRAEASLARWKQPRAYRRVNALPRRANDKLDRRALREKWEAKL